MTEFIQCEFLNPDGTASERKYFYEIFKGTSPIKVGDIVKRTEVALRKQSLCNPFDITIGNPVTIPENENPIRILKKYNVDESCFPSDLEKIAATGTWRCITDYIVIEQSNRETYNGESTLSKEPTYIKEDKNMNIKNLMGNVKFGKLDDANIKYSFNGIAFRDANNNYNVYNDGKLTNVSDMVIDMPVFAMPVPFGQIEIGDVILHPMRGNALIVQNIGDNAIDTIEPYTNELKTFVPVKSIFGFDFYTKVISLADGFGANANADNPFGNMLPFLMFGDGKMDKDTMLMFAMMNGGNGFSDMNAMLPFLLMSNKGGDNDALSTLMLMNMFKNQTPAINANVPKEFADYVNNVSNKVED